MKDNSKPAACKPLCVAVDVQNDFITGTLGSEWAAETVPGIIDFCKEATDTYGAHLIRTFDTHYDEDYLDTHEGKVLPVKHCIDGTEGHAAPAGMEFPRSYDVEKDTFMTYPMEMEDAVMDRLQLNTVDLMDYNGPVFVFGFCTSICVAANALLLRGLMPEADIRVVADLCADVDAESHAAALRVMANNQIPSVSAEKALEIMRELDAAGGELSKNQ